MTRIATWCSRQREARIGRRLRRSRWSAHDARVAMPSGSDAMQKIIFQKLFFALCAMLGAIAAASAQAQDNVASFYAGKSIRLVVGIDVGSGYDVNARLLARHLGNHIPGKPTNVVQNQPGAGSAIMTSQLYTAGQFEGTAIGAPIAGMP